MTNSLTEFVKNKNGFATLVYRSERKALKKGKTNKLSFNECFKDTIFLIRKAHITIGYNYENCVNNQLVREDKDNNFISEQLPWGQWVITNKVIEHKESLYLRFYEDMNANKSQDLFLFVYANGCPLTQEEIDLYLSEFKPKESEAQNQGTDKEIKPRTIKFDNVLELTCNKETWERLIQ